MLDIPEEFEHGLQAYKRGWCKCDICTAANRKRFREEQADRVARLKADPTIREHGVRATWTYWGCKCALCYDAVHIAREQAESSIARKRREIYRKRLMHRSPKHSKIPPFGREWLNQ